MYIDKSQKNQGLEVMSRHADAAARPRHHDTLSGLGDRRAQHGRVKEARGLDVATRMARRGGIGQECFSSACRHAMHGR